MARKFLITLFVVWPVTTVFAGVVNPDLPPGPHAVRVVIAEFSGGHIGVAVGQIIGLQIWRTFRLQGDLESTGEVVFDRALPHLSYEEAELRGTQRKAAAVLWGEVIVVGDGVIVQAHLSLLDVPKNQVGHEWVFTGPPARDSQRLRPFERPVFIVLDCPRRRYDFEPITFDRQMVESVPAIHRLPLFASAHAAKAFGHLGNGGFRALMVSGDAIRVETGKQRAWVRLPQLAPLENEVAQFTAGIVRFLRKDWFGARQLFDAVAARRNVPEIVGIDASLYGAVAQFKERRPYLASEEMLRGRAWEIEDRVKRAISRNPYLRSSAATLLAMYAAELSGVSRADRADLLIRFKSAVDQYRPLFSADDSLFLQMSRLVRGFE